MLRTAIVTAVLLLAVACGDKLDAVQETECAQDQAEVTYEGQVKAILDEHCTSCHSSSVSGNARSGAPSGVDLDTYQSLLPLAEQANTRIQNETMPPGSNKVPASQKSVFMCWIDQGKNEQ